MKVDWQKEPRTIINTFTNEEVSRMIAAYDFSDYLNARNKTIMAFFVDTGARNYETCCVRKDDIRENVILAGELAEVRKEIRCSPHTIRHFMAQAQLKNGLDVYSLSRILGHENIILI